MNDNNADFEAFIGKYIERNFGGSVIKIDYEKDYISLDEFQKYECEVYLNFHFFLKNYHQGKLGLLLKFLQLFIIFIANIMMNLNSLLMKKLSIGF